MNLEILSWPGRKINPGCPSVNALLPLKSFEPDDKLAFAERGANAFLYHWFCSCSGLFAMSAIGEIW
jgi:hypothetical protein